jgi:predicted ester cyclase
VIVVTDAEQAARPEQATRNQRAAIRVVLRFFDAFNNRDVETMKELIDDEHIDHTYFGGAPVQPDAVVRAVSGMLETFPDWHETVDEIYPGRDGTVVVRQTGRGTQRKKYMGREPSGRQIAETLVTVLRIKNGKIKEYRSTFPFTRPWDETITSAEDLQEARAEQGGLVIREGDWRQVLEDFAEGRIDFDTADARRDELPEERARCQTLLAENMRRCVNPAAPGSVYCPIHQEPGEGGGFGATE